MCIFFLPQISAQVSSRVRKELQTLFFGSSGTGELPESLLHWLSQRYVSSPDLQALLASLEMSILRNVSLQLERSRVAALGEAESEAKTVFHTVSGAVQHTAAAEGLTEEVKMLLTSLKQITRISRTPECFNLFVVVCPPASEDHCPKRFATLLSGQNRPGGLCPRVWR